MNRYAVTLYSNVDGATVWIIFPVNTPMTKQQHPYQGETK
jgi:hypothetical protein